MMRYGAVRCSAVQCDALTADRRTVVDVDVVLFVNIADVCVVVRFVQCIVETLEGSPVCGFIVGRVRCAGDEGGALERRAFVTRGLAPRRACVIYVSQPHLARGEPICGIVWRRVM